MRTLFAFAVLCVSLAPLNAQPPEPARPVAQWKVRAGNPLLIEKPDPTPDFGLLRWIGQAIEFSPDGALLAIGGRFYDEPKPWDGGGYSFSRRTPGLIKLWDAVTGARRGELHGHEESVTSIAFSPNGKMLATMGSDSSLFLWDMETGTLRHRLNEGHKKEDFPDWESFQQHRSRLSRLVLGTWSPDSKTLATYELAANPNAMPGRFYVRNFTMKLFDGANGQLLRTFAIPPPYNNVLRVGWAADGKSLLAEVKADVAFELVGKEKAQNAILVLDGQSGEVLHHVAQIVGLGRQRVEAFSPDGRYALIIRPQFTPENRFAKTETMLLWDVDNDRAAWTHSVPRSEDSTKRHFARFSEDGKVLVTAKSKGEIILHDVVSGEVQQALNTKVRSIVNNLEISPDARRIAVFEPFGTIHLWNLDLPIPTPDE